MSWSPERSSSSVGPRLPARPCVPQVPRSRSSYRCTIAAGIDCTDQADRAASTCGSSGRSGQAGACGWGAGTWVRPVSPRRWLGDRPGVRRGGQPAELRSIGDRRLHRAPTGWRASTRLPTAPRPTSSSARARASALRRTRCRGWCGSDSGRARRPGATSHSNPRGTTRALAGDAGRRTSKPLTCRRRRRSAPCGLSWWGPEHVPGRGHAFDGTTPRRPEERVDAAPADGRGSPEPRPISRVSGPPPATDRP